MLIKSLFPTPIILLMLQGGGSSEGNLTTLALVYMGVGLLAGLVAAPIFGGILLLRRNSRSSSGSRLTLSLALALLMGVISGLLTIGVYATGILPPAASSTPCASLEAPSSQPEHHSSSPGPSPATSCLRASQGSFSPQ